METRKIEIKVLANQGDTPGSIAVVTAKEQREKLKERYKEFKQDKK